MSDHAGEGGLTAIGSSPTYTKRQSSMKIPEEVKDIAIQELVQNTAESELYRFIRHEKDVRILSLVAKHTGLDRVRAYCFETMGNLTLEAGDRNSALKFYKNAIKYTEEGSVRAAYKSRIDKKLSEIK